MRRPNVVMVTVMYGQEPPRDITTPLLRIILRHLKLEAAVCYTNRTPTEYFGQVTTSCEHGR